MTVARLLVFGIMKRFKFVSFEIGRLRVVNNCFDAWLGSFN